jgi:hypothetical protein
MTSTITNDAYGDDQVRAQFGMHQDTGDGLRIREKLEQLAWEYTARSPTSREAAMLRYAPEL